nr:immunoglobulin heavy chain junction region [Mus musculus]
CARGGYYGNYVLDYW